LQNLKSED